MPTIAEYLEQGRNDRLDMINNLSVKGVTVSPDSTFSEMVPRILDISQSGITPTGTINITSNGVVDVTNYASANVNVSGSGTGDIIKGNVTYAVDMDNFTVTHNANCAHYIFVLYKKIEDCVASTKSVLITNVVTKSTTVASNIADTATINASTGNYYNNTSFGNAWNVTATANSISYDNTDKVTYRPLEAGTYTWIVIPLESPTV